MPREKSYITDGNGNIKNMIGDSEARDEAYRRGELEAYDRDEIKGKYESEVYGYELSNNNEFR